MEGQSALDAAQRIRMARQASRSRPTSTARSTTRIGRHGLVADIVELMYDVLCDAHGGLTHQFLHEAAHAVAAIDNGISFSEVRVLAPAEWIAYGPDRFVGGGVWLTEDARIWVPRDPLAAMRFILAGACAEEVVLGHSLPDAVRGDFDCWRRGAGLAEATTPVAIDGILGASIADVHESTKQWVADRYPGIKRVLTAMTGVEAGSLAVVNVEECRSLTESEVRDLAG